VFVIVFYFGEHAKSFDEVWDRWCMLIFVCRFNSNLYCCSV